MGGHALKTVRTRRIAEPEYALAKSRVLRALREHGVQCEVVRELPHKHSFGDLDVLVVAPSRRHAVSIAQALFSPREIVENGDIVSFDLAIPSVGKDAADDDENEVEDSGARFQIDFIRVQDRDELAMTRFFSSYGDFGSLLGRLVKEQAGLSFGHRGLWVEFEDLKDKVMLSAEPRDICAFLGTDFAAWERGFATSFDVIAWIKSSRFFEPKVFARAVEGTNHMDRKRMRMRPFYREFVRSLGMPLEPADTLVVGQPCVCETAKFSTYVIATQGLLDLAAPEPRREPERSELRVRGRLHAVEWFARTREVEALQAARHRHAMLRAKFQPKELFPGLEGRELGRVVVEFKAHIAEATSRGAAARDPAAAFEEWLFRVSPEELARAARAFQ